MTAGGGAADDPSAHLLELLGGKHRAQALSTAAALGIADRLLAGGTRSPAALAPEIGCADVATLASLLRVLAGLGFVAEPAPDEFALTARGRTLCRDRLGAFAEFVGAPDQWDPWARLRDAMRAPGGGTAFERAAGRGLYEYLAHEPVAARRYDAAIEAFTRYEGARLRDRLEIGAAATIVDVGGGRGTLLLELLADRPDARGVLFDLPHVIRESAAALASRPGADRIELVAGDFTAAVPTGGDVYLLKHVLHNWDDERARALLCRCAEAMADGGRIVVIDAMLAPDNRPDLARMLDLEMRVLTGGRERRKPELRRLFAAADLSLVRVEQLSSASWLLIAERR